MVNNSYIKCQVCGSITRVRLQVGKLKQHPIVITCGKCKTSLCGKVIIGQVEPSLKFQFDNADVIYKSTFDNGDYLVECSGEFPVKKQCEDDTSNLVPISPFIRQMMKMYNNNAYEDFFRTVSQLNETAEKWTSYKRILDLFQNKSEYLVQEIKKEFHGPFFSCNDEAEILRTVHNIEVMGFYSPLKKEILNNLKFSDDILRLDPVQMKSLNTFLNSHNGYHLEEMQSLIYSILDEFINVYPALIPSISLQYSGEDSFDYENEGSTTSTFDTVKQFYLNVYEALGNLMIIPVAFNNIKYRGNIDISATIDSKTYTLEEYIELTKAKRYHFCLDTEMYTEFLGINVNAKLRNAIGHNDVNYDIASQLITYIPNPKDRTKKKTKYLLEFENEAIHMFQGILAISEYLYRLRELKMMQDGNVSMIMGMSRKINIYDLCPCGSGKKFKFCHRKK
ncbi:MAG: SEC-C domain-containing protein [Oscillospiraceae bacterium]|nr:SEC-C domain-containing protein [Oscillospiraceae bacterium]